MTVITRAEIGQAATMNRYDFTLPLGAGRARAGQPSRQYTGWPLITIVTLATSGCAVRGAPSFVLFGAFFPAWMFVAGIGILAAIAARAVLVATGLAEVLPFQLLVCCSAGLTTAVLLWLLWFET